MPTFGRLGKHSNRSQHGLHEQPPAASAAQGSGTGDAAVGGGSGGGALADAGLDMQSALSSTAGSPRDAIDGRQQQQLQQQIQHQQKQQGLPILQTSVPNKLQKQQPQQQQLQSQSQAPAPPPHLYSASSTSPATNNPSPLQHPGGDFVFDARQQQQQHPDFVDPTVHRSQSLRYPSQSSLLLQNQLPPHQQQVYGVASTSVDDLPSPASFQQLQQPPPQPAPEKHRTNRKLHIIKGIFGSVRGTSDTASSSSSGQNNAPAPVAHPASQPYNPNGGLLGRRSSNKRDSRIPPSFNTVLPVTGEDLDNSSYDELNYQPPPHLHPHQQQQILQQGSEQSIVPQDQQLQYDNTQGVLDPSLQSSQQHQLQQQILFQQTTDGRLPTGYPGSQNPETASQLSRESSAYEQDLRNQASQALQLGSAQHLNQQSLPSQQQQPGMPPQGSSRRSNETEHPTAGQAPGYRHSNAGLTAASPLPPQGATAGGQSAYRGDGRHFEATEPGRETPQPTSEKEAENPQDLKQLLAKYKNVKRLYFDGRSQIEQLHGQVEQLQNAVANQRMSQSRTALDDNEYATRFNRLNGAINNLSFNIRKDWSDIPSWLVNFVSPDALKTGKQEMTAVGRAVISRWIVTELFDKCFHPDLDPHLSSQLKDIEMGIRGNTHIMHRPEEFDAQTTKIVNWRMATLDGLQKVFNTQASENRAALIQKATTNLAAYLQAHLTSPPPPGIEGSTSVIVELAISVAANLPLESRDVSIWYPMPGDILQPNLMEVETAALPPLEESEMAVESDESQDKSGKATKLKTGAVQDPKRVRFAGFVALEVKGRQVLIKAPVWTI